MKRIMRNTKRQLGTDDTIEILQTGEYGTLSTISSDNTPYIVPISYAYVRENDTDCIFFHSSIEGHKLDNIKNNNNACFNVVTNVSCLPAKFSTLYKSATCFGKIEFVTDTDEKLKGIRAIMNKYSSDFTEAGEKYIHNDFNNFVVLKLTIEHFSGKGRIS